jgi:ribosomal protein S18 acetylase RimI-like enzyme
VPFLLIFCLLLSPFNFLFLAFSVLAQESDGPPSFLQEIVSLTGFDHPTYFRFEKTMHPLENVIWQALTTRQTAFAEGFGSARRFIREVTLLSGFERPDDRGYDDLAVLAGEGGTIAVFLDHPYEERQGWEWVAGAPLVQMICVTQNGFRPRANSTVNIVPLGVQESPEMIELTTLTKPGPFGPRTHELGTYIGIRDGGRLAAMAGERLKVPGFTEVSAVCTHPDFLGKGFAGMLMSEVMCGVRDRGETPFLHVRQDNTRAIALYERLGFRTRHKGHFAVLRRKGNEEKSRSQ